MYKLKTFGTSHWCVFAVVAAWLICSAGCGSPRINIRDNAEQPDNVECLVPTTYRIGQGDELEILYHIVSDHFIGDYKVGTGDTIRIDFYYYPVMSRTVRLRPDGYITLPKVGDVKAAGLKPSTLAENIKEVYKPHLSKTDVTVEVIGFNTRAEELKKAVTTVQRGQSKLVVVRPDGIISLPYIKEIHAAGLTSSELGQEVEKRYEKFVNNISVTVAVQRALSNRAYVMGQVNRPNFYVLPGPVTLTQLIAQSGGFAREANTHQVVLISRSENGEPAARTIDMNDIIGKGDMQSDPIIKQYDVVYVPRTGIAKASIVGESLWRLIPLTFDVGYSLGGKAVK